MEGYSETGEWDFAAGSVKGYREWSLRFSRLLPDGPLVAEDELRGNWGGSWRGTEWHEADCTFTESNSSHLPPVEVCGCGFWAHWNCPTGLVGFTFPHNGVAHITRRYWGQTGTTLPWIKLILKGIGEGAGRVIIGERGFRSQKMRIRALCFSYYREGLDQDLWSEFAVPFRMTGPEVKELAYSAVQRIVPDIPLLDNPDELKEYM